MVLRNRRRVISVRLIMIQVVPCSSNDHRPVALHFAVRSDAVRFAAHWVLVNDQAAETIDFIRTSHNSRFFLGSLYGIRGWNEYV
jgi:hypothetical protein